MTSRSKYIVGIDPGNEQSAYVLCSASDLKPISFAKLTNELMYDHMCTALRSLDLDSAADVEFAIEMIASYGLPVGAEVFDTCRWIGRLEERLKRFRVTFIFRKEEKVYICGSMRANDANIRQALVDRFAPGQPNFGKGTKKNPGFFFGFKADVWQSFAVACTYAGLYGGDIYAGR